MLNMELAFACLALRGTFVSVGSFGGASGYQSKLCDDAAKLTSEAFAACPRCVLTPLVSASACFSPGSEPLPVNVFDSGMMIHE